MTVRAIERRKADWAIAQRFIPERVGLHRLGTESFTDGRLRRNYTGTHDGHARHMAMEIITS